ncbi:MAG: hypothetical protein IJ496_03635 [Ruminococcus sp.]|nr:hypothetical protein [Ruminococcus sp.]
MDILGDAAEFLEFLLLAVLLFIAPPFLWTIGHILRLVLRKKPSRLLDTITLLGGSLGYIMLLVWVTSPPAEPEKGPGLGIQLETLTLSGNQTLDTIAGFLLLLGLPGLLALSLAKPEKLPSPVKYTLLSFAGAGVILQFLWLLRFFTYYWNLYSWQLGTMTLVLICAYHFNFLCTAGGQFFRYLQKPKNTSCKIKENSVQ